MKCVNLLIINGHLLVREALRALFRDRSDIRIVGEVCDYGEAMSAACARTIDVVVLDLAVPGLHRIDKIRELKAMQPTMKILVISAHSDLPTVSSAMAAGASGFLIADYGLEELTTAIEYISAGRRYVCPNIAHDMATQVVQADVRLWPGGPAHVPTFV
jgi:DNA-binding NarL/FixJ family response regulator